MKLTPARLTMILMMMVAVLVGIYAWRRFFTSPPAPKPVAQQVPLRTVPMALTDLEPGTVITSSHIGMGPYRSDKLERDMFLTNRGIVGRVVKERVTAAQPLRSSSLYAPNELPDLKVAAGKVAYSMSLQDRVQMVDGMIKPGNRVDVMWYRDVRTFANNIVERDGASAVMLVKGIKILAINRTTAALNTAARENTVTMEVTQPQAMALTMAVRHGTLEFLFSQSSGDDPDGLQSKLDDDMKMTMRELMGIKKVDTPKPYAIEHYRPGGRSDVQRYDKNGVSLDMSPIFSPYQVDRRWYQDQIENQTSDPSDPKGPNSTTTDRRAPTNRQFPGRAPVVPSVPDANPHPNTARNNAADRRRPTRISRVQEF